ncbi:3-deoxy-D-manno-octulosonic acid transferase [Mucilaginibacter sp. UYCu711]|uniref:3-deoxy-D-manno-octulosonic acid transferase n=1 Tax=Mucilaginibacter sp. UYCu711 TaxID=3156339 RepID=UPI003D1C4B18
MLPTNSAVRFSQLTTHHPITTGTLLTNQTLIIDNIGMLSSLYQYGDIALIGGGFGAGIHNTLEAAAFGLPVIFGPNYGRFKEAKDLIAIGAGFSIGDEASLKKVVDDLVNDATFYDNASKQAKGYVADNIGATRSIMNHINTH